jgi:hypothetical protein
MPDTELSESLFSQQELDDIYRAIDEEDDEDDDFNPRNIRWDRGVVLFIGDRPSEGATTAAKSSGRDYVTKLLRSSEQNWSNALRLIRLARISNRSQVVVKVSDNDLWTACHTEYASVFSNMLDALEHTHHIVLVYHQTLLGNSDKLSQKNIEQVLHAFGIADDAERFRSTAVKLIQRLNSGKLTVVPYRKRVEANTTITTFLMEDYAGLIFRLYIPNDRLWGSELERLAGLFRDYLKRVAGIDISLTQDQSNSGVAISFYSKDKNVTGDRFGEALNEFNAFLNVCTMDPTKAAEILRAANIPEPKVADIVTRYARDGRRLMLDLDHSRRRAIEDIQYRLSAELIDIASDQQATELSKTFAEAALPAQSHPNILPGLAGGGIPAYALVQQINIGNAQFIKDAQGIIASVVQGDIQYNEHDAELRAAIERLTSGKESIELTSALDELKDTSAKPANRLTAWQRLQGFLSRHSDKIGDTASKLLIAYVEHVLKSK